MTNISDLTFPLFRLSLEGKALSSHNLAAYRDPKSEELERTYPYFKNYKADLAERILLRGQVDEIEHFMRTHSSYFSFAKEVREKVTSILDGNLPAEKKMAELGALLYFLERGTCFLPKEDPFRALLNELMSEVDPDAKDSKNRLLSIFVRLIVTNAGKINKGAIYAIREIIKESSYGFLFDEEKPQILRVLNYFIHSQLFIDFLNETFVVHESVQIYIKMSLKMDTSNLFLDGAEIKRAFLLLYFQSLGQDLPNCYAIADIKFAIYEAPYNLGVNVRDIFQKGGIEIEDGQFIPIASLMEKKIPNLNEKNVVQQMLLATVEFLETNLRPDSEHKVLTNCRASKAHFLAYIRDAIFADICRTMPDFAEDIYKKFITAFQILFESSIWLEDVTDTKVCITKEGVEFDGKILGCSSGPDKIRLFNFVKNHRELKFITETEYQKISTISEFKTRLRRMVEDLATQFTEKMDHSERSVMFINYVRGFIVSDLTTQAISDFLAHVNKDKAPIPAECYKEMDLLYFCQDGGSLSEGLKYFNLKYDSMSFMRKRPALSPEVDRIYSLCHWLYAHPLKEEIKAKQDIFIGTSTNHAFTLLPYRFGLLFQNDPDKAIQEKIILPGATLLSAPLSKEKMERIFALSYYPADAKIIEEYQNKSAFEFKMKMMTLLKEPLVSTFIKAFNRVLLSISIQELDKKEALRGLIRKIMGNTVSEERVKRIENSLSQSLHRAAKLEFYPFVIAYHLKATLIENEIYQFETYDLEHLLASHFGLPCTFEIGDSNYIKKEMHEYFCFGWDPIYGKLSLTARNREDTLEFSSQGIESFRELAIHFPTTLSPDAKKARQFHSILVKSPSGLPTL